MCASRLFDNGAFTAWKEGGQVDVDGYTRWVEDWHRHPGFTWALIPDVIDGDEDANDGLVRQWPEVLRACRSGTSTNQLNGCNGWQGPGERSPSPVLVSGRHLEPDRGGSE